MAAHLYIHTETFPSGAAAPVATAARPSTRIALMPKVADRSTAVPVMPDRNAGETHALGARCLS